MVIAHLRLFRRDAGRSCDSRLRCDGKVLLRKQIHGLEGGLTWDEELCIHCELCINNCNHDANRFDEEGKYKIFYHHCTYCQHCVLEKRNLGTQSYQVEEVN